MVAKSRRQRERSMRIYLWSAVLLAFIVAVFGLVGYGIANREAPLDAKTMCPNSGPLGHYVLLVDKTDPLTFTQRQAFTVTVTELVEKRVPKGYLLSVFVLDEDFKTTAMPLVELCNPGSGQDKSEMTSNLKKLRAQYETKFLQPVLAQVDAMVSTKPANASPIFEMLQLVGINGYRKHGVKGERRLVIVSDMLQNTPQFSMFKSGPTPDFQTFSASDYGRKTHNELERVDVELHYLLHTPALQTKRNLQFWMDYFNKSGARVVAVRPL
jgi:hypothetical protein